MEETQLQGEHNPNTDREISEIKLLQKHKS